MVWWLHSFYKPVKQWAAFSGVEVLVVEARIGESSSALLQHQASLRPPVTRSEHFSMCVGHTAAYHKVIGTISGKQATIPFVQSFMRR